MKPCTLDEQIETAILVALCLLALPAVIWIAWRQWEDSFG